MLENVKKMRAAVLTGASFALTGAVIANAYFQKHQFYPSVVYITKSNPSMAVLYIQAFVFVILLGKLMRKVFFGQLRPAETEHLIERSWYAVTETCLAFTVFRDDFSPRFVAQFTMLLYLKCFHWLIEDRVDYMERSPIISWLFHIRVVSMLVVLGVLDALFVHVAYYTTIQSGASVQLVFGFEYAILLTIIVTIIMKYILHTIDLQSENPWDNKAVHLLYTELITGFIKGALYIAFMIIMIKIHTFPLFAIRPMYLTLRAFKKSVNDVIMSRRAIANMNTLYPDATPEELAEGDNVCIICREEMTTGCKKLPCNHIFHTSCLRSWFQRQQTCPTCRMDVLRPLPPRTPAPGQPPNQPLPQQVPHGGIPPFGMQGFQMWNPMFHPYPGQPQAAQGAAQGAHSPPPTPGFGAPPVPPTTPTTPDPSSSNMQQGAQPPGFGQSFADMTQMASMFPPMMMPPMPFMFPPPMFGMPQMGVPGAGVDLSTLNPEQLGTVESQERQQVEARIAMLRNIHSLLDTAVLQMNQYAQMVSQQQAQPSTAPGPSGSSVGEPGPSDSSGAEPGPSDSSGAEPGPSSSTVVEPCTSNSMPEPTPSTSDTSTLDSGESLADIPSTSSVTETPTSSSDTPSASVIATEDTETEAPTNSEETSTSSHDQVRQRRLQHFESTN